MLQHLCDKCTHASPELKEMATKELETQKHPQPTQSTATPVQTNSTCALAPTTSAAQTAHTNSAGWAPVVLLTPSELANTLFSLEQQ